ncbi:decarboxylating 6-phosphogluconate dehydrogenase [Desulfosporosinus fructosivorans]|uniref:Decarboxylating 6-phosphogluconate dehydrogenase n=1 Tax=Desulfosporosinus fructosivorans TaxID=2018669 RepID=A0A4Z0R6P9_9FIRM|nr:decarboxylating 6-phosphogluconate dehydrogenase [Desulfosporosinus fructosivorans]TGE38520.1 decarboxylating 6-phosphogluconate dehydrogenase [Desulfosporosinus fructosivorans]
MRDSSYGMIGLGKMGGLAVENVLSKGIQVAIFDVFQEQVNELAKLGAQGCHSLKELANSLNAPRVIWLMVPAGDPIEEVLFGENGLSQFLSPGDIIIDGGNSFYQDTVRRSKRLAESGIKYLDSGSSGGTEGAEGGLCLMVGGDQEAFVQAKPLLQALSEGKGACTYVGPSGAGHYTKMVHNAVEYGMLQAIGEGFELLEAAPYDLNLEEIAHLWTKGSIVSGYLMELAERAFAKDTGLSQIIGEVGGGSTGSWAIEEAWKVGVPFEAIALSYAARLRSRQNDTFAGKVVSALRNEFGGHAMVKKD